MRLVAKEDTPRDSAEQWTWRCGRPSGPEQVLPHLPRPDPFALRGGKSWLGRDSMRVKDGFKVAREAKDLRLISTCVIKVIGYLGLFRDAL